eukprot:gene13419-9609_t
MSGLRSCGVGSDHLDDHATGRQLADTGDSPTNLDGARHIAKALSAWCECQRYQLRAVDDWVMRVNRERGRKVRHTGNRVQTERWN